MSKQTCKVVEVTVQPNVEPVTRVINPALPRGKANRLRDKLEDSNSTGDFNPDKLVSYLVQPA
jgi:hypothetical protein